MISRVLFAAVISMFLVAHGVALQKMHATVHADGAISAVTVTSGD